MHGDSMAIVLQLMYMHPRDPWHVYMDHGCELHVSS